MKRPFVLIGSAMFISLLVYSYCGIYAAVAVFGLCAVCAVPLYIFRNRHEIIKSILICVCALLASSMSYSVKTVSEYLPAVNLCNEQDNVIEGTLTEYENNDVRSYYTLENITVNGKPTKSKILISSNYFYFCDIGDFFTVSTGNIYIYGTENSHKGNKATGVYIAAYANKIEKIEKAQTPPVGYYLDCIKSYISENLEKALNSPYSGAVDAMITGNKQNLTDEVRTIFAYSGISHLFAVSGIHLTLWTSLIYFVFKKLFGEKKQILRSVTAIFFVLFFMALTGFTQSVARAGIMHILMLCGGLSRRKADTLNSLFVSVSVILLFNPFAVMSISLQMSFLATLGIVTLSRAVSEPIYGLKRKHRFKWYTLPLELIYTTMAISVISTLFTCYTSAATFGYYSVASPLTNLFCIFAAQLVMPAGILAVIFSFFPSVGNLFVFICNFTMRIIFDIARFIAQKDWAIVNTDTDARLIIIGIMTVALIVLLPVFYGKNKALRRVTAFCTAYLVLFSAVFIASDIHSQKISVQSVGNGTSVIYSVGTKSFVIGCGGSTYKSYAAENAIEKINSPTIDLLIIPRTTKTENGYAYDLISKFNFDGIIAASDELDYATEKLLAENAVRTNEYEIKADENTTLFYLNNENFSGVRIDSEEFKCTILFRPTSDFSAAPAEWQCGDLLITRQSLPQTDISGFSCVFVSTNKDEPFSEENIYSTKTDGSLSFKINSIGGVTVNADYR